MKTRHALFSIAILLALTFVAFLPHGSTTFANPRLADLMIDHFELVDPQTGEVKVSVANTGRRNSNECTLRLIVWQPGQFEQKEAKTTFVKVSPIQSGKTTTVDVRTGVPIINTKYSMFIDISHDVAESNEKNNRAEGEAGNYKP